MSEELDEQLQKCMTLTREVDIYHISTLLFLFFNFMK